MSPPCFLYKRAMRRADVDSADKGFAVACRHARQKDDKLLI